MPRRFKQIAIYLKYDDGNRIVIRSPERRVKMRTKTKLGYYVMLVGAWLIFGHSKEWETRIPPEVEWKDFTVIERGGR